ncbi:LOW QUALITY PROTEIN: hypothetical protein CVT25_000068 [Psilocybe cyanescens]|uniref:Uncharacterized protein n=1 Tax=Psilocybe cyanescens TaxID=93625 RepID=A0A409XEI2_PSICY|nr:LOW QUALITY PROTEIN: hypothetical protein CVT25_000068 [Psilocybe cyanescens]
MSRWLLPEGHICIYVFSGSIADYPEQVYLAGIVQGWCGRFVCFSKYLLCSVYEVSRCTAMSNNLDGPGGRRTQDFTSYLIDTLDHKALWDDYGIDMDIVSSKILLKTIWWNGWDNGFLLSIEKTWHGRFWMILIEASLIAVAPSFPDLQRFPHGHRFKQLTGDDSRALMKMLTVYNRFMWLQYVVMSLMKWFKPFLHSSMSATLYANKTFLRTL